MDVDTVPNLADKDSISKNTTTPSNPTSSHWLQIQHLPYNVTVEKITAHIVWHASEFWKQQNYHGIALVDFAKEKTIEKGRHEWRAYIELKDPSMAQSLQDKLHHTDLDGRRIIVTLYHPTCTIP